MNKNCICLRCGYEWKTTKQKTDPVACPSCKSYHWKKPRKDEPDLSNYIQQHSCELKTNVNWKHPLYHVFNGMKYRCYNSNSANYHTYGAKGISICDEWLQDKNTFFSWAINNGWSLGLCIDRINNNGNYEPNNCRFVTRSQNSERTFGQPNLKNIYDKGTVIGKELPSPKCKSVLFDQEKKKPA